MRKDSVSLFKPPENDDSCFQLRELECGTIITLYTAAIRVTNSGTTHYYFIHSKNDALWNSIVFPKFELGNVDNQPVASSRRGQHGNIYRHPPQWPAAVLY